MHPHIWHRASPKVLDYPNVEFSHCHLSKSLLGCLHQIVVEHVLLVSSHVYTVCLQDGAPGGMSNLPAAGAKTGGYVPPSIRNRAAGDTGDSMNKRREENSVRVTNLSEDTREDDLRVSAAAMCWVSAETRGGSMVTILSQCVLGMTCSRALP